MGKHRDAQSGIDAARWVCCRRCISKPLIRPSPSCSVATMSYRGDDDRGRDDRRGGGRDDYDRGGRDDRGGGRDAREPPTGCSLLVRNLSQDIG